jgi:hypothetical protein
MQLLKHPPPDSMTLHKAVMVLGKTIGHSPMSVSSIGFIHRIFNVRLNEMGQKFLQMPARSANVDVIVDLEIDYARGTITLTSGNRKVITPNWSVFFSA